MQMKIAYKNKSASIYVEYAVILGVVALAFVAMNLYMKRGLQGRLADMSDHFISASHEADANPTAILTSNTTSNSTYVMTVDSDAVSDRGTKLTFAELDARTRIVDNAKSGNDDFVTADEGYSGKPDEITDEDIKMAYDKNAEDKKAQIAILKKIRDVSLRQAESLEKIAATMKAKGQELIQKAGGLIDRDAQLFYWPTLILYNITRNWAEAQAIKNLPKPDGSCRIEGCFRAAVDIYRSGKKLLNKAKISSDEAAKLREDARRAEARIAELTAQLGGE